ncbi:alpha/beta hydrolase [Rubrimonas cliftonensis]|uniref:Phospholipase/carboxylesterase n=1 Tax=Rubrimonas cliftonensis TaxID=89524 RepID=A0A1H3W591_9RHOB|nr:dienelactone hydrolase family protein [Rubrimonas cliftonensis]SDZ82031.1 phospholipase/carboxylesterase [Rubrimonas cliftonensis]
MSAAAADPHGGQPVAAAGPPPAQARLGLVALHGRGASPADILALAAHLAPQGVAARAPAAAGASWWPMSFLEPLEANAPHVESALAAVEARVAALMAEGLPARRIALMGFSQGACLALEHAARAGRRYAGVIAFSGGLVGTGEGEGGPHPELHGRRPKRFDYGGSLGGTPALLSCHERDPHIPLARVRETEATLARLGAAPHLEIISGQGHAPGPRTLGAARELLGG